MQRGTTRAKGTYAELSHKCPLSVVYLSDSFPLYTITAPFFRVCSGLRNSESTASFLKSKCDNISSFSNIRRGFNHFIPSGHRREKGGIHNRTQRRKSTKIG